MSEVLGLKAVSDITEEEFKQHLQNILTEYIYVKNANFILYPGNSLQWALKFFVLCKVSGDRVTVLGKEEINLNTHPKINPKYLQLKTLTEMKAYLKDNSTYVVDWVRQA